MRKRARAQFIWPKGQNGTGGGLISGPRTARLSPAEPGPASGGRRLGPGPHLVRLASADVPVLPGVLQKGLLEELASPVQPRHDRPDRAVQDLGDFLVR